MDKHINVHVWILTASPHSLHAQERHLLLYDLNNVRMNKSFKGADLLYRNVFAITPVNTVCFITKTITNSDKGACESVQTADQLRFVSCQTHL